MSYRFPSDDWIKALMVEVNNSESYRKAAKTWEGDFYFIASPEGQEVAARPTVAGTAPISEALRDRVTAAIDLISGG